MHTARGSFSKATAQTGMFMEKGMIWKSQSNPDWENTHRNVTQSIIRAHDRTRGPGSCVSAMLPAAPPKFVSPSIKIQ